MQAAATSLCQFLNPVRLAGPIFDKELRIASRSVRGYGLRSGYLMLLSTLMLSGWHSSIRTSQLTATAFGVSQASVVAVWVAMRVAGIQLVLAQVMAAVMLGAAISEESRRGSLAVLLTTPLVSHHIVAGKLLSRLLQVGLVLAAGVPALAALRLLGGLPWSDVLAAFCITGTAALFAGALALWMSTYYRDSHHAILACAVIYAVLFVGLPMVVFVMAAALGWNATVVASVLDLVNPFRATYASMGPAWTRPGTASAPSSLSWLFHCLIMAGASGVILLLSVWRVRRAAYGMVAKEAKTHTPVYRLRGALIPWKDNPTGTLRVNVAITLVALLVGATIVMADVLHVPRYEVYADYVSWGFWTVGQVYLAIRAAGAVAGEKESGTWSLLLTTPLGEREILRGKAIAVLRQSIVLLVSAMLVRQCFYFCVCPPEQKVRSLLFYPLPAVASILLIMAAGLYFGVRLRTTTAAASAAFGLYVGLNYLIVGRYNPLYALLEGRFRTSFSSMVAFALSAVAAAALLDVIVGVSLLRRARRVMRHHVF